MGGQDDKGANYRTGQKETTLTKRQRGRDWRAERKMVRDVADGTVGGEGADPDSNPEIFQEQGLRGRNEGDPQGAG